MQLWWTVSIRKTSWRSSNTCGSSRRSDATVNILTWNDMNEPPAEHYDRFHLIRVVHYQPLFLYQLFETAAMQNEYVVSSKRLVIFWMEKGKKSSEGIDDGKMYNAQTVIVSWEDLESNLQYMMHSGISQYLNALGLRIFSQHSKRPAVLSTLKWTLMCRFRLLSLDFKM